MPVDAYCKGCIYRVTVSLGKCCNYIEVTGERRGCPAGTGCTRRILGKTKRNAGNPSNGTATPMPKQRDVVVKKASPKTKMTPEEAFEQERARKKAAVLAYQARAQGKQRAVIEAYKKSHNMTNRDLASLHMVAETTVQKWCAEYKAPDWELLESLGIERPEGI